MKKFLTILCVITCVLGLTACGEETTYTDVEQLKITQAEQSATGNIITLIDMFTEGGSFAGQLEGYNAEEISYSIQQVFGVSVDGNAFVSAIDSFQSGEEVIGQIMELGEVTSRIDGDQIIVNVEVKGTKKDAVAEIIFSNDLFCRVESAALNPNSTFGERMGKAGLNTLIGMFTVFIVLILISLIISLFKIIPKIQASMAEKKKAKEMDSVDHGVKHIESNEAQIQETEESDDTELVAVIAAAIAAYEGETSTDGFVVRSIRKRVAG